MLRTAFFLSLLLVPLGTVLAERPPNADHVVKGTLPTDPNYWKFNEWYKNNNVVVSVIVSGENKEHLVGTLRQVRELVKRKVLIGSIIISGGSLFPALAPDYDPKSLSKKLRSSDFKKMPLPALKMYRDLIGSADLREVSQELGLQNRQGVDVGSLIEKYDLTSSPAWIVRYKGQDYVYEGNFDIKKFFSANGQFSSPDSADRIE